MPYRETIILMKKYIPLFILLCIAGPRIMAQNFSDDNFIYTLSPKKAVQSASLGTLSKEEKTQSIAYFDGLGRPVQITAIGQGGDGSDLVTPMEYDALGRQVKEYLPYPLTNSSTSYPRIGMAASLTSLGSLYNTTKYENTINPFSEKLLEASPLNRVLKQTAPGASWEMGKGHEIKLDYQANADDEVRLYKAVTSWNAVLGLFDIVFSDAGTYSAGELYKNITYDENTAASPSETSGATVEFKNKEGQVVLKRTYDSVNKHDTYYVYDLYGNLTYIVPPKAEGVISDQILNDLCYQYKYDNRNRQVEKKLPGKQWEFIIYDKLDRVVASGPVNSPFNNLTSVGWMITKYDGFNRPIINGWMPASSINSTERNTIQDGRNSESTNFSEAKAAVVNTINNVDTRYTNLVWPVNSSVAPVSIYHILKVNYYDSYDYPGAPTVFTDVAEQAVYYNATVKPKALSTGSWTRVLEASLAPVKGEISYTLYDSKARPVRNYTSNFLGGYKQVDTNFDFTGKTIYAVTTHQRASGETPLAAIRDDYSYSAQNRIIAVNQTISGNTQLLAYHVYDELGKLVSKKVGNTQTAPLQIVDYTYNIRGWLKGINNVNQLTKDPDPKDLFALQLNYDGIADVSKKIFNGNISQTIWASDNIDKTVRNYVYTYDGLNRLKSAVDNMGLFNEENIQYDKNGNILKLQRKGAVVSNPSVSVLTDYGLMDNLTYFYDGGNKLLKVEDAATIDQYGFKDDAVNTAADTADDYTYDSNGNMLTDANKSISANIAYNHLNLPVKIVFPTGNITYLYNAAGQKVQKVVAETSSAKTTVTEYLNGFQYKRINNGRAELQFFPNQEGYVANNSGTLSYVFQYKDHLGNVRLSYARNAGSGLTDIVEENNYYPFGLEHQGYNNISKFTNANAIAEQYKFQGQERQDELSLNWDSFKWRNYDYAIGRFMCIDPLAEKYSYQSPYNFAENRIIDGRELEGLEWVNANNEQIYDPTANNGKGDYTKYATNLDRNIGNSLRTGKGQEQFNTLVYSDKPIQIDFNTKDTKADEKGKMVPGETNHSDRFIITDMAGKVTDVTFSKSIITVYARNINILEQASNDGDTTTYGDLYKKPIPENISFADILGAILGHEIDHTKKENVLLKAKGENAEKEPTKTSDKILDELKN